MKVLVATRDYYGAVAQLFQGHTVELLSKNWQKEKTLSPDLMVFTGGEDVYPEYYGQHAPKSGWFNRARDEWELTIVRAIRLRQINPRKILGICRGMQMLNVAFGGSLTYDIFSSFGKEHKHVHPLTWTANSPLAEIFPVVNSMHHQALHRLGDSVQYRMYAVEPVTGTPEVVCWEDKFLGVQFHPEFMSRRPEIVEFVKFLENWADGKAFMYTPTTPTVKVNAEGSEAVKAFRKAVRNLDKKTLWNE